MTAADVPLGHRPPMLDEKPETLFEWLSQQNLVGSGGTMDIPAVDLTSPELLDGASLALAAPTSRRHRTTPLTTKQRKELKERLGKVSPSGVSPEAVWQAVKKPKIAVRTLDWKKLPADAMAFYRPFHYPPFDQWGVYLLVEPLLKYIKRLQTLAQGLNLYSPETLAHLVLFEVFHHEFFHHMAESTATYLEILGAASDTGRPVYLEYRKRARENGFDYPHAPLEEALANAYAHNALGFLARVKAGYKTAVIKTYQAALEGHWRLEPAGYRDAGHYIGGRYVSGGAYLIAQMIGAPDAVDHAPLSCLAKHLMPNGFTALVPKPDIPTYLVGTDAELKQLHAWVPAPNEAYTTLFWPYQTSAIDAYVAQKQAEERAERAAAKAAAAQQARHEGQQDLFG
ncbi:hypothetical protein [Thiocapsa rosea]|uniref:Uncharacterized protein n=1 Tax=Thiocapsa rosea TaxID=69360 RepID=A0A495UNK9_9GAMM|nr:hypothetical protein [Thiocapsa rosea]RKT37850.1 hypothetical protein BDD21_5360 [Thiocapsa rosea]